MQEKKFYWFIVLLGISHLLILGVSGLGFAEKKSLTILHTNDLHSHLQAFPYLATLIKEIRQVKAEKGESVLVLDSGDFMMGTLYHLLTTRLSPELTLMSALGYDALTLGNHEFDCGTETLAKIIHIASQNWGKEKVPIITSNIQFDAFKSGDNGLKKLYNEGIIQPYLVKKFSNGLKVGIIGLLGKVPEQESIRTHPLRFTHNLKFIQCLVNKVKNEGVDILICLSHSGLNEDKKLARLIRGIDVIIGGHCHTAMFEPITVGNTFIVQAGSYAKYLGKLEVLIEEKRVFLQSYQLIPLDHQIMEDKIIEGMVRDYTETVNEQILSSLGLEFHRTVAKTNFKLIGETAYITETNLGDLFTDAIRFAIDLAQSEDSVDFAFYPTGFLRGDIYKGAIRVSDVFRISSLGIGPEQVWGYPLVSFYLNAKEIKKVLEISVLSASLRGKDYLLQVSGLRFWYNPLRPPFKRVTRIEKWDEKARKYVPFDPSNTKTLYKVGTNLFLLNIFFLIKRYLPDLSIVPRDKNGILLLPENPADKSRIFKDVRGVKLSLRKIKEWQAFMSYISHFPDLDNDLIPDIPPQYSEAQARINLDSNDIFSHYLRRKNPLIAVGAALIFPSLGHMYAHNWYPNGSFFFLMQVGSAFLLFQESTKDPGIYLLASLKIWECYDAYNSVVDYNKRLERTLQMVFSSNPEKPGIALVYRF